MAGERATQETYDEGRLSERIMLAALAHGVGSSIGWFVGDGPAAAKEILGVPEDRTVRTALSWLPGGRGPAPEDRPSAQAPSEIVREERYG